jgi:hypothetical protein
LKYRQLYKQAFKRSQHEIDEAERAAIRDMDDVHRRRQTEQLFEERLGIPRGHVIIDVPSKDIHQAEPRILETDLPIVDNGKIHMLHEYTPVADAIRKRAIPEWEIMILTESKYRSEVARHAASLLFSR